MPNSHSLAVLGFEATTYGSLVNNLIFSLLQDLYSNPNRCVALPTRSLHASKYKIYSHCQFLLDAGQPSLPGPCRVWPPSGLGEFQLSWCPHLRQSLAAPCSLDLMELQPAAETKKKKRWDQVTYSKHEKDSHDPTDFSANNGQAKQMITFLWKMYIITTCTM